VTAKTILVGALVAVAAQAVADGNKPVGKGFWKVLVQPGARWVMRGLDDETLTVETYDVRTIGKAQVARLRWTLRRGSDDANPDADALKYTHAIGLTQVAVTDAGAYLLYASYDDAKVAEELKKPPSRSDPPKAYKPTKLNEGRSLEIRDDVVCMLQTLEPDCDGCDGAAVCISATDGIVSIEGTWAPSGGSFRKR
jgi:hypothetical protein